MYNSLRVIAMVFLGLTVTAGKAWADSPAPVNFKGIYDFSFSGMRIGKLGIEVEQGENDYAMTADIATTGIVKLFSKHTSHTTVDGTGTQYRYPNRTYQSNYQTKKKPKSVKMTYKDNKVVQVEALPHDSERPVVSDELRDGSFDPLSFLLEMRRKLWEARQSGVKNFSIKVYDGRRLTEANFTIQGKKTIETENGPLSTIVVGLRRKLLAGFTESELADHDPKEPTLYIYFSNDARLMPIHLEAKIWLGIISASLAKECRTGESCLLGLKE